MESVWDPNLGPCWAHLGSQNGRKSIPNGIQDGAGNLFDFVTDFASILRRFWASTWAPKVAQDGPKNAPEPLQRAKLGVQNVIWERIRLGPPLWSHFGSLLESFWHSFRWFFGRISRIWVSIFCSRRYLVSVRCLNANPLEIVANKWGACRGLVETPNVVPESA